jgi:hypothetical protein
LASNILWTILGHYLILQLDISHTFSGLWDTLSHSFQQNSILWILISVGLGGLLTAALKFVFEQTLPEWRQKRAKRIALQKYSFPLTQAAYILYLAIERLIDDIRDISRKENLQKFSKFEQKSDINPKDDYYCLSILYAFPCFFGWYRILENEAFLEFSELYEKESNIKTSGLSYESYENQQLYPKPGGTTSVIISAMFNKNVLINLQLEDIYHGLFKDIVNHSLFGRDNYLKEISGIPKFALNAIGDLMINESQGSKKVLSFIEFIQIYNNDGNFRKCLSYIVDVIIEMERSSSSNQGLTMILKFYLRIREFLYFKQITMYGQNTTMELHIRNSEDLIERWNLTESDIAFEFLQDMDLRNRVFTIKRLDVLESQLCIGKYRKYKRHEKTYDRILYYFDVLGIFVLPLLISRRVNKKHKGKESKKHKGKEDIEF